ncbi:hypothetical protein A0H81_11817 [Grifola frondosa]|uniref:Uncharacterized protein n=1 Tax=Grifola frondosa TaxID=5627 RepID=A0A1C7LTP9_GRIFR|nr:hypothetical protein A0H81_11817 [Grifola frondosa]
MRESEPPKGKTKAPASSSSTSSSLTAESEDNDNAAVAEQVLGEVPADPQSPVKTGEIVKVQTPKSLAVAAQPREANGRFGKKASTNGRYMRKNFTFTAGGRRLSRAQRAKYRSKVRAEVEKEREEEKAKAGTERVSQDPPAYALPETESAENMESAAIKRLREEEEEEEEDRTGKKPRVDEEEEEEAEAEAEEEEEDEENDDNDEEGADSLHFRVPLAGGMKSGVGLLSGANPVAFARRKWVCVNSDGPSEAPDTLSAFGMQSSTDDDADLPVTPEDETDHTVAVVDSREELSDAHEEKDEDEDEDEDANHVSHAPSLPFRASYLGRLTFKPSPVNLARRRWAPQPKARTVNDVEHIAESCRKQSYLDPPTPASLDLFKAEPLEVMRRQNRATNTRRSPSDAMEADISSSEEDAQSSNHSLDDSERDSEQAVERIVLAPPSEPPESRPPSAPNRSPPSTQMSPGLAWKQTVLLPSNVPYPDFSMLAVSFPLNAPSSPAKLINAGWDTSSDTDS